MKKPAYALATILVLLGVAMFGAAATVTISVLDSRISRSQQEGVSAYYVTEAGAQDAMWRINTTPAYSTALQLGTLNVSYSVSNKPATGQGFSVSMVSSAALGPGYATVTVTGTSNNGTFTARKVVTTVYQGPSTPPTGTNALMSGQGLTLNAGATNQLTVSGGDLYSTGAINITQTKLNMGNGSFQTPAAYTVSNSTLTNVGSVHAISCSPTPAGGCQAAAPTTTVPSFNFAYYATHNNASYTSATLQTYVNSKSSPVSLPGPVTYINGNLSIGSWLKNKTLNITGMLVVNGSLTVSGATNSVINIIDPGNGQSGLFINGTVNNSIGTYSIDGTFYAAQTLNLSGTQSVTVNGAILGLNSITFNSGVTLGLTYSAAREAAVFGTTGTAPAVSTQYWEEQY